MSECAPLGVGLIGCGEFAFYCWEAFSQLGDVRLVAAADVSAATANRFVDRPGELRRGTRERCAPRLADTWAPTGKRLSRRRCIFSTRVAYANRSQGS